MTTLDFQADRIRTLVFDLDGTLYQNEVIGEEVSRCANRYLASLKGVSEEVAALWIDEQRALQPRDEGGTLSQAVLALGGDLKELHRRMELEVHPEGVLTVDPRVPELLGCLGKRYGLYLYTNNNRELSARIMTEIGVAGLFRKVFSIEDFWLPKPDRMVLENIFAAIGTPPEETLFVGDRYEVDLRLPAALGCQVYESRNVEELLALNQLCRVSSHG